MADSLKRKSPPSPSLSSQGPSKKPFIDTNVGLNGNVSPPKPPELETFRKEAIWRQMSEYKLRAFQAEQREKELERTWLDEKSKSAAVGAFWTKLVEDVRILCDQNSLPHTSGSTFDMAAPLVDLELPSTTLTALQSHLASLRDSTLTLVQSLSGNPPHPSVEALRSKCTNLVSEAASLRAAVETLREDGERLRNEREDERERCRSVWKRAERQQFDHMRQVDVKVEVPSPAIKVEIQELPQVSIASKDLEIELESLKEIASRRLEEIDQVRHEKTDLENQLQTLKLAMVDLPEETIQASLHYRQLHAHLSYLKGDSERAKKECEDLRTENSKVRELQNKFRDDVLQEARNVLEDSQKKLAAKEADLTRVRGQREEFRSELTELKARELEKIKYQEQVKTLALSQKDRLTAYASEVKRLKMRILANNGETELVDSYADEELDAMKDLEARLKRAESLALTLRDQLKSYSQNSGLLNVQSIMKSEEDARMEARLVTEKLERLEAIVGEEADVNVKNLKERLEQRDRRVRILEAQLKTQEASTSMLYGEVDRLSAAWQTLDEQMSNKVFTFVGLEEKISKLLTEKAKADNRYFAAMRAREASQSEIQMLNRLTQKQQQSVETALEGQKSLSASLTNAEEELSKQKLAYQYLQTRYEELTLRNQEMARKEEVMLKKLAELDASTRELIESRAMEQSEKKRLEEDMIRLQKSREVTQLSVNKSFKMANGNGTTVDGEVEQLRETVNDLQKLLKCSSCNERLKSHVVTRCFHTFCKECIDSRIGTRQRKCPSCQVPFGVTDVQKIWLNA